MFSQLLIRNRRHVTMCGRAVQKIHPGTGSKHGMFTGLLPAFSIHTFLWFYSIFLKWNPMVFFNKRFCSIKSEHLTKLLSISPALGTGTLWGHLLFCWPLALGLDLTLERRPEVWQGPFCHLQPPAIQNPPMSITDLGYVRFLHWVLYFVLLGFFLDLGEFILRY